MSARMTEKRETRPNIILILADDLGYSDLGCYGSEITTPNLDRMAENGVRYTQMYNHARCCPSRASLLTGLSPHQAGIGHMTSGIHDAGPAYQGFLRENCVSIAEALKVDGYKTGMVGKWHVGGCYPLKKSDKWAAGTRGFPTPIQRGFDRFYGTLEGAGSYFNPHTLMEGGHFIRVHPDEDYYYTDAITAKALEMVRAFHSEQTPFFLYVAYTAPHWPLHAHQEDIEKYEGKYLVGWDEIRAQRYERLRGIGIIDRKWELSPRNLDAFPWERIRGKAWEDRRMATYAAQVDCMDQGIGRILNELYELQIGDDTIMIFLSDNGGCAELLRENGWVENYVGTTRTGGVVRPGNDPNRLPGDEDTYMSYGLAWANASNTPFRLFKHWVHEGGIATPLVVHWPAGIEDPGRLIHNPVCIADIMPTCLDIANVSQPKQWRNRIAVPLEGESFYPLLQGENWEREKPIIWEHEGNCAVRSGVWKLVRQHPSRWELYNMQEDRTELVDLAGKCKRRVKEMGDWYREWADRCGVLPWTEVQNRT